MINLENLALELDKYDIFEGMTSISAVIKSISQNASNRKIISILYDSEREDKKSRELSFIKRCSMDMGFEVLPVSSELLTKLTSGETHGGIVALCTKRTFSDNFVNKLTNASFFALIDGIEDPYNFAYSIRSLYASGVDGIILPPRNWMDYSGTVARSSAGTSELADIYVCDTLDAVKKFKDAGFKIVCASIRDSVSIYDYDFTSPTLLIVGGEKRGISKTFMGHANTIVHIPYSNENAKYSFPTASCAAIFGSYLSSLK
jgi:23S rRNA (guanosine2251-2'-O)-methyltransferase